jgi:hypothetical protein
VILSNDVVEAFNLAYQDRRGAAGVDRIDGRTVAVNFITLSCPGRHATGRLRCPFTVFSMGPGFRRDDGVKCGGNASTPPQLSCCLLPAAARRD